MAKYKINLVTMSDVKGFTDVCGSLAHNIHLTDGKGYRVSAKSLLGAMAALEWDELYCESDEDIYMLIEKYTQGENY